MVTQPSRRAFLTGRRTPASPWGQFCARLSRTCVGKVRWDQDAQSRQAWLEPARAVDVMHAQALCGELGVQLLLLGSEATPDLARPILWVDSRSDAAQLELVDHTSGLWRVDAGVTLATLRQQGVGIFARSSAQAVINVHGIQATDAAGTVNAVEMANTANQTLAQWFASPFSGSLMHSGIVRAEVLLADGTLELLGPFGAQASTPLRSLSLQSKIPKLFELAQSSQAALCAQSERWPLRYRLDALMPQSGDSLNLAWLFQGHGGSLAWLQTLWLQTPTLAPSSDSSEIAPSNAAHTDAACSDQPCSDFSFLDSSSLTEVPHAAQQLDHSIKQTLDPTGVFGKIPPAKGIESTQFT